MVNDFDKKDTKYTYKSIYTLIVSSNFEANYMNQAYTLLKLHKKYNRLAWSPNTIVFRWIFPKKVLNKIIPKTSKKIGFFIISMLAIRQNQ